MSLENILAAKKIKREAYGIEINNDFCKVANDRIKIYHIFVFSHKKTAPKGGQQRD